MVGGRRRFGWRPRDRVTSLGRALAAHLPHCPNEALWRPGDISVTSNDEMDSSNVNDSVGIIVPGSLSRMHRRSPP